MLTRSPWFLGALAVALAAACATGSSVTKDDEESESSSSEGNGESSSSEDDGGGSKAKVNIPYKRVAEAVVENTIAAKQSHRDVNRLRKLLCENHESDDVIFYHLTISKHWHYYWLCSENKAHRVSTKEGEKRLKKWIADFKRQASVQSRECTVGDNQRKCMTGTHGSGIQALAYCDGRIMLAFPDGDRRTTSFDSQASGGGQVAADNPPPAGDDGGDTSTATCPPCPACPTVGGRRCPDCPPPTPCPPPRVCPACPACPVCPPCNCKPKEVEAGKAGFTQGVKKACARICQMIYNKCRSLNPNTSLCYQVSDYCANECSKP